MDKSNIYISSFYSTNISNYFTFYQRKVFQILGIKLHQICEDNITHGDFLNKVLRTIDVEYFIFFDIDCIPLSKEAIDKLIEQIKDNKTLAGAIQTANQFNEGKNHYVGPFFFGIGKKLYKELGEPDLNGNEEFDVGGQLTDAAIKQGAEIKYWYPSAVEINKWPLYQLGWFGIGTTYEKMVYHLFESRYSSNTAKLIRKTKEVIKNNFKFYKPIHLIIILEIFLFRFSNFIKRLNRNTSEN